MGMDKKLVCHIEFLLKICLMIVSKIKFQVSGANTGKHKSFKHKENSSGKLVGVLSPALLKATTMAEVRERLCRSRELL